MHKDELYKLSDDKLKESGLYVCRQCGDYVAASESVFLRHINSKHIKTRKTTNHKIVTNLLYSLVESHKSLGGRFSMAPNLYPGGAKLSTVAYFEDKT